MNRMFKKIVVLIIAFNLCTGIILFGGAVNSAGESAGHKPEFLNVPSIFQKDFRLSVYHAVEYVVLFEKKILEICGEGAPPMSKIEQDRTHHFIDDTGNPFSLQLLYSKKKKDEDSRIRLEIVLTGTAYERKLTAYIDPETYILARIDDENGALFVEKPEKSFSDILGARKIPPKTIPYVTKTTERYMKAIYKDLLRMKNVLLVGERGTGKDSMILELGHRLNMPCDILSFNEELTTRDLTQRMVLVNGRTEFIPSVLIEAMRSRNGRGHWVVLDEIDRANPGVLAVLNHLLQFREITLTDGSIIRAGEDFRVIATMNPPGGAYAGQELSSELEDRFLIHYIRYLPEKEEIEYLSHIAPKVAKEVIINLVRAANDLRKAYKKGRIRKAFSTRGLVNIVEHLETYPNENVYAQVYRAFNMEYLSTEQQEAVDGVLTAYGLRQVPINITPEEPAEIVDGTYTPEEGVYTPQERDIQIKETGFIPEEDTGAEFIDEREFELSELIKTLRGHTGWVDSVQFSPDGKRLVSGSLDNTIRVWDLENNTVKTLKGHNGSVISVQFSPDGKKIASGSDDNTIRVWDLEDNTVKILEGHNGSVNSVQFSPDGKKIISGSEDKTIKIWDLENNIVNTLRGHTSVVHSVQFSSDGKKIVSGSEDSTIKIWNLERNIVHTLKGHPRPVYLVQFSPDGKRVVSGSMDKTIRVWDLENNTAEILIGGTGQAWSVQFSPDGKKVVSGSSGGTILIWDLEKNTVKILKGHSSPVYSVQFSPDGNRIVSGSNDSTIKVWDLDTEELEYMAFERLLEGDMSVPSFAKATEGKPPSVAEYLDIGPGIKVPLADGGDKVPPSTIRYLTNTTKRRMREILKDLLRKKNVLLVGERGTGKDSMILELGHRLNMPCDILSFNEELTTRDLTQRMVLVNGRTEFIPSVLIEAMRSRNGRGHWVVLDEIDRANPGVLAVLNHLLQFREITLTDGTIVKAGDDFRVIATMNPPGGAYAGQELSSELEDRFLIHYIRYLPEKEEIEYLSHIAPHVAKELIINLVRAANDLRKAYKKGRIRKAFSTRGLVNIVEHLEVYPNDNVYAQVYRAFNMEYLSTEQQEAVDGVLTAYGLRQVPINISPEEPAEIEDGTYTPEEGVYTPQEEAIQIEETRFVPEEDTGEFIDERKFELSELIKTLKWHGEGTPSVQFSPDGKKIVSGTNTIRIWDLKNNTVKILRGHTDAVYSLQFSPDGKRIVSGSVDKIIRVWDLENNTVKTLNGHTNIVNSVQFSPDGKKIVSGSSDSTIKVWDLENNTVKTLEGHTFLVLSVQFSPDGKKIVSGSTDRTIKVWDLENNTVKTLKEHTDRITSVQFSPDGKRIVSGSHDHTIKVWDLEKNTVKTLKGHTHWIYSVQFSPDGKMIVSGSWDRTIKVWDLENNTVKTLRGHSDSVWSVQFSPDGKKIISGSRDNTIRVWELDTEELEYMALERILEGDMSVPSFEPLTPPSPQRGEGVYLDIGQGIKVPVASGGDKVPPSTIRYLTDTTKRRMREILKDLLRKKNVLLVGERGTGKDSMILELGHRLNMPCDILSFNEELTTRDLTQRMVLVNGRTVFIPSVLIDAMRSREGRGHWVVLDEIDRANPGVLAVLNHLLQFREITLTDGTVIKAGEDFRVIATMNPPGGAYAGQELSSELEDRFLIHYIRYLPEKEEIEYLSHIAPHVDKELIINLVRAANDLRKAYKKGRIRKAFSTRGLVNIVEHLEVYPNDNVYAQVYRAFNMEYLSTEQQEAVDGVLTAYGLRQVPINISPEEPADIEDGTYEPEEGEYTPEEENVIPEEEQFTPEQDTGAEFIDEREFELSELVKTLRWHGEGTPLVQFSPDGKKIVSGTETIRIWDLKNNTVKILRGHTSWVRSVQFSPDGKRLVSGAGDRTIKVWDLENNTVKTLRGHTDVVLSVRFSPDGKKIVSGSDDSTIRIWDLENNTVKTLEGHTFLVLSVQFSPDGKKILSGSSDKTIRLWDLEKNTVKTLKEHTDRISLVQFSPDGKKIVSGSYDHTIKVWDLEKNTVKTLKGHTHWVCSVQLSPDGKKLVSGSRDKTIRVWNLENNTVKTLRGHNNIVESVQISPDGKKIVSGSSDSTIKVWDLDTEELEYMALERLLEGDMSVPSFAKSTEGEPPSVAEYLDIGQGIKVPLADGGDKVPPSTIRYLTDTTKRKMREILKDLLRKKNVLLVGERGTGKDSMILELGHRLNMPCDILSFNEELTTRDLTQRMVLVNGRTVFIPSVLIEAMRSRGGRGHWVVLDEIDRANPGVLAVLNHLLQFREITLTDGTIIKAGEDFRVIATMNPPGGAYAGQELSSELEDRFLIHYIRYLPEKEEIEYLSHIAPNVDKELIINLVRAANDLRKAYKKGRIRKAFSTRGLVNIVEHLEVYPNDNVYAQVYRAFNMEYLSTEQQEAVDNVLTAYGLRQVPINIAPEEPAEIEDGTYEPEEGEYTPQVEDIQIEETGFIPEEDTGEFIDEREFELSELIKTLQGHTYLVSSLQFSPDGKRLVSGSWDNTIKLWDLGNNTVKTLKGHTESVVSVQFSPDGKRLVSGSIDSTIRVWDLENNTVKIMELHIGWVSSLQFSPDGKRLVSGSWDNTIKLWDLGNNTVKTLKGHTGVVRSIQFSPDGKRLVSGSDDHTIRVWELGNNTVKTLRGHTNIANSVRFSPDGKKIVSGSYDHTIKVWDLEKNTVKTLKGHTESVVSVQFSPDGKRLVSGSIDRTIRVWELGNNTVKTLKGHTGWVYSVQFSHDGKKIVSGSEDSTIKVWDLDTEELEYMAFERLLEGDMSVPSLEPQVDPDGRRYLDIGQGIKVEILRSAQDDTSRKVPQSIIPYLTDTTKRRMREILKDLLRKKNVLLVGERGTGKDSMILELGHRLNMPCDILSFNEELTTRDLTQRMVLVNGRTEFIPSVLIDAMRSREGRGHWVVLDEIDRANPGVLAVLNHLLQFREITLTDGTVIKAGEDFRVIATMNPPGGAYAGQELSSELEDRFLIHYIRYLPEKEEIEYLSYIAPHVDKELIINLVRAANDLRKAYKKGRIRKAFSTRGLVNIVEHLETYPGDNVYAQVYRAFNMEYLSTEQQAAVDGVLTAYGLRQVPINISPEEPAVIEDGTYTPEEGEYTPQEEDIQIEETGFIPEEDTGAEFIDEREFELSELVKTLIGHAGKVSSVQFSPDGKRLVSGSIDRIIRVWDLENNTVKTIEGHINWVHSIQFSSDGKRLVSGSGDSTIRVWDLEDNTVKILEGHNGSVNSVQFSPDGKKIVSGAEDSTIKVWNLERNIVHTLKGHSSPVYSVQFSPDGKKIVSGSTDRTIKVWDLENNTVKTLKGHTDRISLVQFSPDGKKIVSGSYDHTIKVWDLENNTVKTLKGHTGPVYSVQFSPDGKRIISGARDRTIKVWDLENKTVKTLGGHTDEIISVQFSHDGKKIVSGSEDKTIKLWNLDTEELEYMALERILEGDMRVPSFEPLTPPSPQGGEGVYLDIGPGIKVPLADGGDKVPPSTIRYLTNTTKRRMREILKDLLRKKNVLLVGERGTGKDSMILELGHRLNMPCDILSFNEELTTRDLTQRMVLVNGRTEFIPSVLIDAMRSREGKGHWAVLDEIDRANPGVLAVLNHLLQFREITLTDGTIIRAGEDFRVIATMNPPGGAYAGQELSSELEDRFLIHYIRYLPEKEEIEYLSYIAPHVDKELIINLVRAANDLRKAYKKGRIRKAFSTRGLVNIVEHLETYPNDNVYAQIYRAFNMEYLSTEQQDAVDGVLTAYGLRQVPINISPEEPADIEGGTYTPEEGEYTSEEEKVIPEEEQFTPEQNTGAEFIDEREFELSELIKTLKGHSGSVASVQFSPDGKRIASGADDNTIRIWNLEKNTVKTLRGHADGVRSLQFSADGKRMVSGALDNTIKIWDFENNTVKTLRGHTDVVFSARFSPDGKKIVSGSDDNTIRLWDLENNTVKIFEGHLLGVRLVEFTQDGKKLVSGADDGIIKIWDLENNTVKIFESHTIDFSSLQFSPDGKRIVSGSVDKIIRVWDLENNTVKTLKGHTAGVTSVQFSPDGKMIVSGSEDGTIKIWNLDASRNTVKTLKGHTGIVWSVQFSPDGKMIVSGSEDRTIKVWNLDTEELEYLALERALTGSDDIDISVSQDVQLQREFAILESALKMAGVRTATPMPVSMAAPNSDDGLYDERDIDREMVIRLQNLASILSHQDIVFEPWRPVSHGDLTDPTKRTWRVFLRQGATILQFLPKDLKDKVKSMGVTAHEIWHVLFTDHTAFQRAIMDKEEKQRNAMQVVLNSYEDPRINIKGTKRHKGLLYPLRKLYDEKYPRDFSNLAESQALLDLTYPLHAQFGFAVVHDWAHGKEYPLLSHPKVIEAFRKLRHLNQTGFNQENTLALANFINSNIWPVILELIEVSKESKKEQKVLERMHAEGGKEIEELLRDWPKAKDGRLYPLHLPLETKKRELERLEDKKDKTEPDKQRIQDLKQGVEKEEERQKRLKELIQEKWDSMSEEEREEINQQIDIETGTAEQKFNESFDPKITIEPEVVKKLQEIFEEIERTEGRLNEHHKNQQAKEGAVLDGLDKRFLEREGVSREDYDFYQKYYNEVAGQAQTLKSYLRRIKVSSGKKKKLRHQEDGEIDEDELPYVGTGEYKVMYRIRRPRGLYYKVSFLVDLSGSMQTGSRIEDAIRGLIVLLETIEDWPKDIVFEVAGFSSSEFIPIWDYEKNRGKKKLTLADKVMIIKKVYNLGQGGTNAARAVEEAVSRIKPGDKKFRRLILMTTDGELFGDDAEKIRRAQNNNPFARIVPLGIGPDAGGVKDLPDGHWVQDPRQFSEVIYQIMDDEFRQQANGRHGMVKAKPVFGQQLINLNNSANMVSPNLDTVEYEKRHIDKTKELLHTLKDRIKKTGMHVYIDKGCLPENQRFILEGKEWQKRKEYFEKIFPGYSFELFSGALSGGRTKENTIILMPASSRAMYKDLDARLLFIEGQREDTFFHLESFVYLGAGLLNLSTSDINGSPLSSIVNRLYRHITGSGTDIRAFLTDYRMDIVLPPIQKFSTAEILELQSYAENILMQSA